MRKINIIDAKDLTLNYFITEHFHPRIPLVIKNLFKDCKIDSIKSNKDVKEAFGDLEFECVEEYTRKFIKSNSFYQNPEKWSLKKYLNFIEKNPETNLCIREFTTPKLIIDLFKIPDLIKFRKNSEITSNIFIANSNNVAHMHYDGDNRNVLLYQVFGRKRVILVSEAYSKALLPVLNQSWLNINSFSEKQRNAFVEMVDGYDFVLEPGDTMFFPMMQWHHLEYVDTGMSINFRFGRNDYNKFLSNFVHTDLYVQGISAAFNTQDSPSEKYDNLFAEIKKQTLLFDEDPINKYKKMRDFMKKFHYKMCGDILEKDYYLISSDTLIDNNPSLLKIASRPYYFKNWAKGVGIEKSMNDLLETL
ncbi:MAG: hypothetical protein Tsb005_14470 [Gammaproteobacteria bacterium]